jgi:hypothetical protein
VLAPRATGIHDHSTTLGSGSRQKNYLTGFGRGYVLRKWGVLASPGRLAQALLTDGAICLGQALIDRNVDGIRGRVQGLRRARPVHSFPAEIIAAAPAPPGGRRTFARRLRRRRRLRGRVAAEQNGHP